MAGAAGVYLRAASLGRAATYAKHGRLPLPLRSVQAAPRGCGRQIRLRVLETVAASSEVRSVVIWIELRASLSRRSS